MIYARSSDWCGQPELSLVTVAEMIRELGLLFNRLAFHWTEYELSGAQDWDAAQNPTNIRPLSNALHLFFVLFCFFFLFQFDGNTKAFVQVTRSSKPVLL